MTEFDTLGKARDELERRAARRGWRPGLRESALFDRNVIHEIQRAAREGIYDIRGFGAKRAVPHFDDLLFLGASMSRYPLEGYRERCDTDVVLGDRHAARPLHLEIPITIAGMSFGALSGPAKEALGRGASEVGTSTTTGDGGMTPEEREHSTTLVYQLLPSRYGMNPDDLRRADAIEIVVGQGDADSLLRLLARAAKLAAARTTLSETAKPMPRPAHRAGRLRFRAVKLPRSADGLRFVRRSAIAACVLGSDVPFAGIIVAEIPRLTGHDRRPAAPTHRLAGAHLCLHALPERPMHGSVALRLGRHACSGRG